MWGEAVTTTADAALAAMDNRDREPTTIDAAADFLSELYLADGPRPTADVIEASREKMATLTTPAKKLRRSSKLNPRKAAFDGVGNGAAGLN